MKKLLLVISVAFLVTSVAAQRVGINTAKPTQELDVNGNVNIDGKIMFNGLPGQARQVLTTDDNGSTVWANTTEYSEHLTFNNTGSSSWNVPAGVTKILVEAWGAGGGGSPSGGGGGGGYITGYFTVAPGATVSYTIGSRGNGVTSGITTANSGGASSVTVNSITLTASGGAGSYQYSSTGHWLGRGGSFSVSPTSFRNWAAVGGEDGSPNQINFIQPTTTTIWETTLSGKGGNAGNTTQTGAQGGYAVYNTTASQLVKYVTTGRAKQPGGGGCGNLEKGATYYGSEGEDGMVRIHY